MSDVKVEVGPPVLAYPDHDQNFTMFDIKVEESNLGNHWIAKIEAGGKVFEARHASRTQAISDVERAARDAHTAGVIIPGVF